MSFGLVVGLKVDDDPQKVRAMFQGAQVFGSLDNAATFATIKII